MSGNTYQITPFMHVADFDGALRFLTETLGFTPVVNEGGYAYLDREGAGLRLMQQDDTAPPGTPHGGYSCYIDVKSVETVLDQIGPALAALPPEMVRGPVDQPWGQRELMIRAPDGNLIVFGASLQP